MTERSPVFELHILPMFRLIDKLHMLRVNPQLDLLNYDSVKANADDILSLVPPTPALETNFSAVHHCDFWRNLSPAFD